MKERMIDGLVIEVENSKIPNLQIEYIINSTFVWPIYGYLLIQPDSVKSKQKHTDISESLQYLYNLTVNSSVGNCGFL